MRFIWKFPIKNHFEELTAPIERFLTAQMQGDTLCVWAIVDVEKEKRMFGVSVMGTGWPLDERIENSEYVATVQDGVFVWHVFARPID